MKKFILITLTVLLAVVATAQQEYDITYQAHQNGNASLVMVKHHTFFSLEIWDDKGNESYYLAYEPNDYLQFSDIAYHQNGVVKCVKITTFDYDNAEQKDTIIAFNSYGEHIGMRHFYSPFKTS